MELRNGDHASDDLAIEVYYVLGTEKLYPSESLGPSENPLRRLVRPLLLPDIPQVSHPIEPLLRLDMRLPDVTLGTPNRLDRNR